MPGRMARDGVGRRMTACQLPGCWRPQAGAGGLRAGHEYNRVCILERPLWLRCGKGMEASRLEACRPERGSYSDPGLDHWGLDEGGSGWNCYTHTCAKKAPPELSLGMGQPLAALPKPASVSASGRWKGTAWTLPFRWVWMQSEAMSLELPRNPKKGACSVERRREETSRQDGWLPGNLAVGTSELNSLYPLLGVPQGTRPGSQKATELWCLGFAWGPEMASELSLQTSLWIPV